MKASAPVGAAVLLPQSIGSGRGRRTLGTGPTLRDDLLSLLRAVAHPCATWALSPGYDGPRKRTDHGFDYEVDPHVRRGRRSVAMGVERHMEVPRSRNEARTPI